MTYENLASTKILATNCAVCGRALRDAVSVEMGIGPDCREKYGYNDCVNEHNRQDANQLIYLLCDKKTGVEATEACRQLRKLGFQKLSMKIATRLLGIRIEQDTTRPGILLVTTPYTEAAVRELKSVPGRVWNRELYVNEFPVTSKNLLWNALRRAFGGQECIALGEFYTLTKYGEEKKDSQVA